MLQNCTFDHIKINPSHLIKNFKLKKANGIHPMLFYIRINVDLYDRNNDYKIFSCLLLGNIKNSSQPGGVLDTKLYIFLALPRVVNWKTDCSDD